MIELALFVWAWLYTAAAIEAQAAQIMAKTAPPPKRRVCCNYITKEGEKVSEGGGIHGERSCRERQSTCSD